MQPIPSSSISVVFARETFEWTESDVFTSRTAQVYLWKGGAFVGGITSAHLLPPRFLLLTLVLTVEEESADSMSIQPAATLPESSPPLPHKSPAEIFAFFVFSLAWPPESNEKTIFPRFHFLLIHGSKYPTRYCQVYFEINSKKKSVHPCWKRKCCWVKHDINVVSTANGSN